jgi:TIGR03009 family protein
MRARMLAIVPALALGAGLATAATQSPPAERRPSTRSDARATPSQRPAAPAATATAAADDPRLDTLLRGWEAKSRTIQDMYTSFQLISRDNVFHEDRTEYGRAWCMRPYLGRLDFTDEKGNFTRVFVSTGKAIHQYDFKSRQEIVHLLPETQAAEGKNMPGPLSFIFGMSAGDTKARFNLRLEKQDDAHAWVEVTPRAAEDQQEFKVVKLVFDRKTYLPKQMLIVEPSGSQQMWMFTETQVNINPPLSADQVAPPPTPKGWTSTTNQWGKTPAERDAGPIPPATPGARSDTKRIVPTPRTGPEANRPQTQR